MSKWLSGRIIEEAGRRIYESQQARLSDQTGFAARRAWRSKDVPTEFWNSYCEDARAALSLISVRMPSGNTKDANLAGASTAVMEAVAPVFPRVGSRTEWAEREGEID